MVSGSVSLELLARQTPAVAVYRGTRLTEFLARRLVSCRYMSLPNLLIDDELMPEFPFSGGVDPWIDPDTGILDNWNAKPSPRQAVIDRIDELLDALRLGGANLDVEHGREAVEQATEPLVLRGVIAVEGERYRVRDRNVLRYYARSLHHLLHDRGTSAFTH